MHLLLFLKVKGKLKISLGTSKKVLCRVANDTSCQSVGECELFMAVKDRVRLVKVLVIPEIPHTLIIGINFN